MEREAGGDSCAAPLDDALTYVRYRGGGVLPMYLLAMAPHAMVMLMAVDALAMRSFAAVREVSVLLTVATLWRWVGLALVQRRVQIDLRGEAPSAIWRRLPGIVMVRLYANVAIVWGGLLVIPGFYGLLISTTVTPAFLEGDTSSWASLRRLFGWISGGSNRLLRTVAAASVIGLMLMLSLLFVQILLVYTALPSLLGLSASDLSLTVGSWSWVICMGYLLFLMMDFYWAIAGVFLYYDLQASRLGTDLRARLRRIEAETK